MKITFCFIISLIFLLKIVTCESGLESEDIDYADLLLVTKPPLYADKTFFLNLTKATLRKCHCDAHEAISNNECKKIETFVGVFDHSDSDHEKVNTSSYGTIQIGELICQAPKLKATLSDGSFSLLTNGNLILLTLQIIFDEKNYCINHFLDEKEQLQWLAEVCLEPPPIPRCCSYNKTKFFEENSMTNALLNNKSSIIDNYNNNISIDHPLTDCPYANISFSPPIIESSDILIWDNLETFDNLITDCNENSTLITLQLDYSTQETILYYSQFGPYLSHTPSKFQPIIHKSPDEFCLSAERKNVNTTVYSATFCSPKDVLIEEIDCNNHTCVRKCCLEEETYDEAYRLCIPSDRNFEIGKTFYDYKRKIHTYTPQNIKIVSGFPSCNFPIDVKTSDNQRKQPMLLNTGHLYIPQSETILATTHYCIEDKTTLQQNHTRIIVYCQVEENKVSQFKQIWKQMILPVFLGISCVFMFITLCVFLSIKEIRNKMSSQCLISQVASLLAAYMTYIVILVSKNEISNTFCQVIGKFSCFQFFL